MNQNKLDGHDNKEKMPLGKMCQTANACTEEWQLIAMSYCSLKDLNQSRDDWIIIARVIRCWECINFKMNNDVFSIDMVLMDEQSNVMHGTIPKNRVPKFRSQIHEGCIYLIRNVRVIECDTSYKPVEGTYRIQFLMTKSLKEIKEPRVAIPKFYFKFYVIHDLDNRSHDTTLLSDVIGILNGIGEIQEIISTKTHKRYIRLETITISLWGKICDEINEVLKMENGKAIVIIVTSTNVKEFQGDYL
ncbi:replication protein A 70 kDa DNA-binding subunit B-like [Pistacia vera]|uniref:replication protein A 70 kDa DNA-binding subunit B-like n=1 Tax=Pistacia vera TaxID=55513 RepID=UPI00126346E4|nr:replication protein A 70 kDa DNA-binding subunit B-like [Pistacia vera]